jgi:glutathione S-transferase
MVQDGLSQEYGASNIQIYVVSSKMCDPCYLVTCDFSRQVPSLEHSNKVIGESLDLIKYMNSHFDGPKLTTHVSSS